MPRLSAKQTLLKLDGTDDGSRCSIDLVTTRT
jgi:hypothetical protein